ncbi:MAG: acyltransferase [Clostridiales bacterium]|nr:acyltransferase [Clostridiales bacterium]
MTDEEFAALFERYMARKRDEMKEKYNRVLPSGELIFNRFDKSEYLNCKEGSSIYDTSVVMGDVRVGEHVWVGPYTLLDGSAAPLTIGDNTTIDSGVMIYTHDSTKNYVSGGVNPFDKGEVRIGSNTVIGSTSIITCGVTIGDHCVVGANSFVNKDVPDYSIAAGSPARIIGKVIINDEGEAEFEYF